MLIDAIEGGPDGSPEEETGLRYVQISDAALRSGRTGETIYPNLNQGDHR